MNIEDTDFNELTLDIKYDFEKSLIIVGSEDDPIFKMYNKNTFPYNVNLITGEVSLTILDDKFQLQISKNPKYDTFQVYFDFQESDLTLETFINFLRFE